jgi:hypothetical protein
MSKQGKLYVMTPAQLAKQLVMFRAGFDLPCEEINLHCPYHSMDVHQWKRVNLGGCIPEIGFDFSKIVQVTARDESAIALPRTLSYFDHSRAGEIKDRGPLGASFDLGLHPVF